MTTVELPEPIDGNLSGLQWGDVVFNADPPDPVTVGRALAAIHAYVGAQAPNDQSLADTYRQVIDDLTANHHRNMARGVYGTLDPDAIDVDVRTLRARYAVACSLVIQLAAKLVPNIHSIPSFLDGYRQLADHLDQHHAGGSW